MSMWVNNWKSRLSVAKLFEKARVMPACVSLWQHYEMEEVEESAVEEKAYTGRLLPFHWWHVIDTLSDYYEYFKCSNVSFCHLCPFLTTSPTLPVMYICLHWPNSMAPCYLSLCDTPTSNARVTISYRHVTRDITLESLFLIQFPTLIYFLYWCYLTAPISSCIIFNITLSSSLAESNHAICLVHVHTNKCYVFILLVDNVEVVAICTLTTSKK